MLLRVAPPQHLVQRLAFRLAENIPKRNVDAAEREAYRAVPSHGVKLARQIRHERRHVGNVTPDA